MNISIRSTTFLFFIFSLITSQYFLNPAYAGYIFAFLALFSIWLFLPHERINVRRRYFLNISTVFFLAWFFSTLPVTFIFDPDFRDVARDVGAVLFFFVGRYLIPNLLSDARRPSLKVLHLLSIIGIFVALLTLAGASRAYLSGASAYVWRGQYIPMVHSWLPYLLVANVALIQSDKNSATQYIWRSVLCIVASLASLSRTDLLLEIIFLVVLLFSHGRVIFKSPRFWPVLLIVIVCAMFFLPKFLQLAVVQERIEVGFNATDDASLGWRAIENQSLINFLKADHYESVAFGHGWGARMPLISGYVDFVGNNKIPHLHNSFLTIVLKFGVIGLVLFGIYLASLYRRWWHLRTSQYQLFAFAGIWIIIFVIGKAITLQGLSEWSHVMFFGLGCGFLASLENTNTTE